MLENFQPVDVKSLANLILDWADRDRAARPKPEAKKGGDLYDPPSP
jgi:hypothetical protein